MAGASKETIINVGYAMSVSWTETGTSTPNNTSTISITGAIWSRASYYAFYYNNAGAIDIYWHDNHTNSDVWVNGYVFTELGYDNTRREVSGSITVTHNSDGTLSGYAFATWNRYVVNQYVPPSANATTDWVALTTIPRASTPTITPNTITIPATGDETFKITTNRASSSFTHDITIKSGATTIKTISGVGASTDVLVSDIDDDVLATIPNAKTATLSVQCVTKSGNTNIGTKTVNMTANVSQDAAPTFSNYTYADTNSTTTAITGNNSVMVSGKSTLAVTISSANKATAQYDATMSKYTFAIADIYEDENYSASSITKTLGSPTIASTELPSGTRDLVVSAIDSRGLNTAVVKSITIVPYESPIVNATAKRVNGFENDTTLKISGKFSRIEVSGTAKNTVNSSTGVKYRYKAQSTSTWGSWINKSVTVDTATGTITATDITLSLDNQQSYDIEVQMTDKLETATVSLVVSVGQPAFFIGTDGRVSVGSMPTKSLGTGETGLFEIQNGRIYGNIGVKNTNLVIATDTPASWVTALGQGRSMNDYTASGKFTNQPSTNGVLDTMVTGNYVVQEWTDLDTGKTYRRAGSNSTWALFSGKFSEIQKASPDSHATGNTPTTFVFNTTSDTGETIKVVTNRGTALTIYRFGGGAGNVITGSSTINHVRGTFGIAHSTTNGNYGVCGLRAGSYIWTYWGGARDGNYGGGTNNGMQVDGSNSGYYYGTLVTTSGNKNAECCRYDAVRMTVNGDWSIQGQIQSSGSGNAMAFCAEVAGKDTLTVPALYVRGAGRTQITRLRADLEVFET